ncbi:Hypothetical predicted protein [Pelobates cultripes]|uniref:Uncharacterized protein n=1 Tax=Pelobates cultripes TaxID=61616 RepID=A0AAD1WXF0_PELCU|nr:Hypothetical predicted protein [Pelobates cultripes]
MSATRQSERPTPQSTPHASDVNTRKKVHNPTTVKRCKPWDQLGGRRAVRHPASRYRGATRCTTRPQRATQQRSQLQPEKWKGTPAKAIEEPTYLPVPRSFAMQDYHSLLDCTQYPIGIG